MAEEFPFEISPMYEGERVRKGDMYVELGGSTKDGFELVQVVDDPNEVEDGKVTIIGPDILDMKEGEAYPYGMIYKVAGEKLEKDLEAVLERRHHEFQPYMQGYMHLNQRYDIWVRISKDMIKNGLKSFEQIAKATMMLYKNELPFIEKMEAIYITDEEKVKEELAKAMEIYRARDERARAMHDEDADVFYGCTLCQAFAPTSVCVVTPDRTSLCGAMTWFDCRAAAKVDPEGPNFPIEKGECLDELKGEYTGVNEKAVELSGGEYDRIMLYTFMEYPHTSCGCFEVIGFYMPEVQAIGWVDRNFPAATPNGLPFSSMAGQAGGGKQTLGFLGIGVQYFFSPKFLQGEGGWTTTAWMPKALKDRVLEAIPEDMRDKIATEEDVTDITQLMEFMKKVNHPMVAKWAAEEEEEVEEAAEAAAPEAAAMPQMPMMQPGMMPQMQLPAFAPSGGAAGGIKLVLKNANIKVEKIILKKKE